MVLLRCILSAALATSVAVAVNLPLQRRAAVSTGATIIETGDGRSLTYIDQEYCRPIVATPEYFSVAGAVNISLYEAPCIDGPCALIRHIAIGIAENSTVEWVNDIPCNVTWSLVYAQGNRNTSRLMTSVPPSDNSSCDPARLTLPLSAASLSNETGRIGTPDMRIAQSGASADITFSSVKTGALAMLGAIGVAVLL